MNRAIKKMANTRDKTKFLIKYFVPTTNQNLNAGVPDGPNASRTDMDSDLTT